MEYTIYSPFGGTLVDVKTGAYENKNKYTGKEKDVDTGWYYYGARYYNADNGVFLSEDPVFTELGTNGSMQSTALADPQLQNSYSYARNNPIKMIDADGRWPSLASMARGADSVYNFITLGAGNRAAEMGRTGVTAGGVAHVAGGVAFGTVTTSLAALDVGVAVGGLAINAGVMASGQQAIRSEVTGRSVRTTLPSDPVGRRNANMSVQPGTNASTEIYGRYYTGHSIDRMQQRGLVPSVVENTIKTGATTPGNIPGTTRFSDPVNGVNAVTNNHGGVITTY